MVPLFQVDFWEDSDGDAPSSSKSKENSCSSAFKSPVTPLSSYGYGLRRSARESRPVNSAEYKVCFASANTLDERLVVTVPGRDNVLFQVQSSQAIWDLKMTIYERDKSGMTNDLHLFRMNGSGIEKELSGSMKTLFEYRFES